MRHTKQLWFVWSAVAFSVCLLTSNVLAAGASPSSGDATFQPDWVGTVDDINLSENSVVINDKAFVLQSGATFRCNKGGRSALRKGATVGLKYVPGPRGELLITEICVQ